MESPDKIPQDYWGYKLVIETLLPNVAVKKVAYVKEDDSILFSTYPVNGCKVNIIAEVTLFEVDFKENTISGMIGQDTANKILKS